MNSLKDNLTSIKDNLKKQNSKAKIIAVCKKQPIDKVLNIVNLGINNLGINYLNEFQNFKDNLNSSNIVWHYIGSIQSKKLSKIVGEFDLIHSVSEIKTIEKIDQIAKKLSLVQNILFQLNLSGETTKSGFSLEEYKEVIKKISKFKNIFICGFMTMPPQGEGEAYFKQLENLKKEFLESGQKLSNCDIKHLSMGTSGDYQDAVKYGATHIRLGTILMGQRI